jgi:transcriptional regulator with XRE-family HTH domain
MRRKGEEPKDGRIPGERKIAPRPAAPAASRMKPRGNEAKDRRIPSEREIGARTPAPAAPIRRRGKLPDKKNILGEREKAPRPAAASRMKQGGKESEDEKGREHEIATGSNAPPASRMLERALGQQVKRLRRQQDLSIADLAGAAGLSTGMLSKIENGQTSPSLSTLSAVAEALSVPLTTLFAAVEDRRDSSHVKAGQGLILERRGTKAGHVYQLLGHSLRGEIIVEPYLITLEKDAVPYTGFQHAGVEFLYMLSGEVSYRHADRCYRLQPGDALMFDSAAPHGPEELVKLPMTYLSIIVYARDTR